MTTRVAPLILVVAVLGAATFALYRTNGTPSSDTPATAAMAPAAPQEAPPAAAAADPHGSALPPNHPPIGNGAGANSPHGGAIGAATDDDPRIAWKAPDAFKSAPNPNQMRLATYKIAAAKGDPEDAELAVSRAGGTTDANIERWLGMFDEHDKEIKSEKIVAGFKVTSVEINGTYKNAMAENAAPKKNWAFVAAIVDTGEGSYFFKLTGPQATVKSARKSFDGMIDGIKKYTPPAAPAGSAAPPSDAVHGHGQ